MTALILGFPEYQKQAKALANALNADCEIASIHLFPDGESLVQIPPAVPETVIVCRSLDQPNNKLVELMLAASTLRKTGARKLILVAPYLCYMRQDVAFHPGEAVSQTIIGGFLAELFDGVLTVDSHLHRIERLEQAVPAKASLNISAASLLGEYISSQWDNPILVGPDGESEQWVATAAKSAALEYAVATKQRKGDRDVQVSLPSREYSGRTTVLLDDMVSTGYTLIEAAQQLLKRGATSVDAVVTHAICSQESIAKMRAAGIGKLISTDSVPGLENQIALAPMLAEGVSQIVAKI